MLHQWFDLIEAGEKKRKKKKEEPEEREEPEEESWFDYPKDEFQELKAPDGYRVIADTANEGRLVQFFQDIKKNTVEKMNSLDSLLEHGICKLLGKRPSFLYIRRLENNATRKYIGVVLGKVVFVHKMPRLQILIDPSTRLYLSFFIHVRKPDNYMGTPIAEPEIFRLSLTDDDLIRIINYNLEFFGTNDDGTVLYGPPSFDNVENPEDIIEL